MSKINGPVNVIRLEGNIQGIKKVIYLFMDIHNDLEQQTKCDDDTPTIREFFTDIFTRLSDQPINYDFLLEYGPQHNFIDMSSENGKFIYIHDLIMFVRENMKLSPF